MKQTLKALKREHQQGVIAVEAAIVLPILLMFFGLPSLLFAFYFRQYTAVQKAAHDAAMYLSTAPRLEMTTAGPNTYFAAITVAKAIVTRELTGIVPDADAVDPVISCTYRVAATSKVNSCTPAIFKLDSNTLYQFDVALNVPFVDPVTGHAVDSMYMQTIVTARYLGN